MTRVAVQSRSFLAILAVAALLAAPQQGDAHALHVDCHLRGEKVVVEAYFDDDTPADKAKVRIVDAGGNEIAGGQTDAAGKWSMERPASGRYRVEVNAGGGHFAKQTMVIPGEGDIGAAPARVSEGPSRQEAARMFWPKLAVGLGAIAGFGIAVWIAARRKKEPPREAHPDTHPTT